SSRASRRPRALRSRSGARRARRGTAPSCVRPAAHAVLREGLARARRRPPPRVAPAPPAPARPAPRDYTKPWKDLRELAAGYQELKLELAREHTDVGAYTVAKRDFVARVLADAGPAPGRRWTA